MINPADINLDQLPRVAITEANSLPNIPALYFCISDNDLLYLGITHDLNRRWQAHHKTIELISHPKVKIHWLAIAVADISTKLERTFIQHWQPALNKRLNNFITTQKISPPFNAYEVETLKPEEQQRWLLHLAATLNLKPKTYPIASFIAENANAEGILLKTIDEITEDTGISQKTIITTLKILQIHDIIRRKTGVIILNPNVLFKGDTNKRRAILTFYSEIDNPAVAPEPNTKVKCNPRAKVAPLAHVHD
jgi:hypothetical protein